MTHSRHGGGSTVRSFFLLQAMATGALSALPLGAVYAQDELVLAATATPPQGSDRQLNALALEFLTRLEPHYGIRREVDAAAAIADGELLVFQVRIDRYTLDEPVLGYKKGDRLMLPVAGFVAALYLAIEVDPEAGVATGWAFVEDNEVSLNVAERTARAGDRAWRLTEDAISSDGVDVVLDSAVMAEWLETDIAIDFGQLIIRLNPTRPLPIIEQLRRQNRTAGDRRGAGEPAFPLEAFPYALARAPVADVQTSLVVEQPAGGKVQTRYSQSVLASGDIANMTGNLFVSGDASNPVRQRRATLSRGSPEGGLLGPLDATAFELGDTQPLSLPFSPGAGAQRGISVTNRSLDQATGFGATDIVGDVQPGWDVELYQNNVLIASATVGDDGQYAFRDIPLFAGTNEFRTVLYGLQGQVREETEIIQVDPTLAGNRLTYDLAVAQQGESFLGSAVSTGLDGAGGVRVTGSGRLALGRALGADLGFDSFLADGERHNHVIAGLTAGWGKAVFRALARQDLGGGQAVQSSASFSALAQNIRLAAQAYDAFSQNGGEDVLNGERLDVSLAGGFDAPLLPRISYQFGAGHSTLGGIERGTASSRVSTRIGPALLDTAVAWASAPDAETPNALTGQFGATFNVRRLLARARLDADLDSGELLSTDLNARYRHSRSLSFNTSLEHSLVAGETSGEVRADLTTGLVTLGPRVRVSDDGSYQAIMDARLSLGLEPHDDRPRISSTRATGFGATSVRVFEDVNNDGVYNEGDIPLEDIRVEAAQVNRRAVSDGRGVAFIDRLPVFRRTDVVLDLGSVPDPFLAVRDSSVSVLPRPGAIQDLTIAMVPTSEIEGAVQLRSQAGVRSLAGVRVLAWDEDGAVKAEARTSADGVFVLSDLPVGSYRIGIEPETMVDRGWRSDQLSFFRVREARQIIIRDLGLADADLPVTPQLSPHLAEVDQWHWDRVRRGSPSSWDGYAISLGVFESDFGRDATLLLALSRFGDLVRPLRVLELIDAPAQGGELVLGVVPTWAEASALCETLRQVAPHCEVLAL